MNIVSSSRSNFRRLLLEAVSKAERTGSKERIDRLSLIVVHTVVQGPSADIEEVDEMLRVTVDLSGEDIDVWPRFIQCRATS